MPQSVIQLNSAPVGQGRERSCYVHPDDPDKLVKVSAGGIGTQTRREIDFYRQLAKRDDIEYSHLPRYHGIVETSLGPGIVVDLVRDHDGGISKSMLHYLEAGYPIESFEPLLAELKDYLLRNLVIFNHDLVARNLLLQKRAGARDRLVLIDGIGDVVLITWFNRFGWHARPKIERRWERFSERLYRSRAVLDQRSAET